MLNQNLRKDRCTTYFSPVTDAVRDLLPLKWKQEASCLDFIVASCDDTVALLRNGKVLNAVPLDGTLKSFLYQGNCRFIAFTERRAALYCFDPYTYDITELTEPSAADCPAIIVENAGQAMAELPIVKLSKTYEADHSFSAADRAALTTAVTDAYRTIDTAVRADNAFWQPVMAWVRLTDRRGNIVFESEPGIYTHPADVDNPFDSVLLYSNDNLQTVPYPITVPAFRLKLELPDSVKVYFPETVASIVTSPVLYRHDLAGNVTIAPRRRADDKLLAHVKLPVAPVDPAGLIARRDRIGSTASPAASTLDEDARALRTALRKDVEPASFDSVMLSAPHTFTPSLAVPAANVCLFADLDVWRAVPPRAEHFSPVREAGSFHAALKVEFADGSSLVTASEGLDRAPVEFGPVLSYPAPDAVALTISVKHAGSVAEQRFELAPDPSARRSLYIHPSLRPFRLAEKADEVYAVPAQSPACISMPNAAVCSSPAAPLRIKGRAHLPEPVLNAAIEAFQAQGSWDYGRARFYLFARQGIYMLNADPARSTLSAVKIDSRAVAGAHAVCRTEHGVAAIASGDIVLLTGNKITRIADIPDAKGLVWCHRDHELWVAGNDSTTVVCLDRNYETYSFSDRFDPLSARGNRIADTDGRSCVATHSSALVPVDISWTDEIPSPLPHGGLAILEADIDGHFSDLTIEVRRRHLGRLSPGPEVALHGSASIKSPFRRTIRLGPADALSLSLSASAMPGASVKSVNVLPYDRS